jgi:hypothetical protein
MSSAVVVPEDQFRAAMHKFGRGALSDVPPMATPRPAQYTAENLDELMRFDTLRNFDEFDEAGGWLITPYEADLVRTADKLGTPSPTPVNTARAPHRPVLASQDAPPAAQSTGTARLTSLRMSDPLVLYLPGDTSADLPIISLTSEIVPEHEVSTGCFGNCDNQDRSYLCIPSIANTREQDAMLHADIDLMSMPLPYFGGAEFLDSPSRSIVEPVVKEPTSSAPSCQVTGPKKPATTIGSPVPKARKPDPKRPSLAVRSKSVNTPATPEKMVVQKPGPKAKGTPVRTRASTFRGKPTTKSNDDGEYTPLLFSSSVVAPPLSSDVSVARDSPGCSPPLTEEHRGQYADPNLPPSQQFRLADNFTQYEFSPITAGGMPNHAVDASVTFVEESSVLSMESASPVYREEVLNGASSPHASSHSPSAKQCEAGAMESVEHDEADAIWAPATPSEGPKPVSVPPFSLSESPERQAVQQRPKNLVPMRQQPLPRLQPVQPPPAQQAHAPKANARCSCAIM